MSLKVTQLLLAKNCLQALEAKDVTKAMILALALNDYALLRKVYEEVGNFQGDVPGDVH